MLFDSATLALLPRSVDAAPPVVRGRVLHAMSRMALALVALALLPHTVRSQSSHLFVWAGGTGAGILLTGANWPPGLIGNVMPHGAVFSR